MSLIWPERPTCHDGTVHADIFQPHLTERVWRPARPDAEWPQGATGGRTCSYCGCVHPEDLLHALDAGAKRERADLKYGSPYKFYICDIPNSNADTQVVIGERDKRSPTGERVTTPIYGRRGNWNAMWDNEHVATQALAPTPWSC